MDLPKNEKTFSFSSVGETTGQKFEGNFTVVCVLDMFQKRAVELEKGRITADQVNPTMALLGQAEILSNLRNRIVDGPSWWKDSNGGFDIIDENICVELYDIVMTQEAEWKEDVKKLSEPKDEKLGEGNMERK